MDGYQFTETSYPTLRPFLPIMGEFIYMYQLLKYYHSEYTIDNHIEFMKLTLRLAIKGELNLGIDSILPQEQEENINTIVHDYVMIYLLYLTEDDCKYPQFF